MIFYGTLLAILACSLHLATANLRAKTSFHEVEKNFLQLQELLDSKVPRDKQVGHTGWLTNMSMYYWNIARSYSHKTICEVGFGVGFTSTIWLTGSAATVYSFDLFPKEGEVLDNKEMAGFVKTMGSYQQASIRFLQEKFPGRFVPIAGYSDKTIPAFAQANSSVSCDLILIDGSHTTEGTLIDTRNFKALAHKDTIVLIDDFEYGEIQEAVNSALAERILTPMVECIQGEKLINPAFGHPGYTELKSAIGKKFCRTKYQF